jgi:hypothetical protein
VLAVSLACSAAHFCSARYLLHATYAIPLLMLAGAFALCWLSLRLWLQASTLEGFLHYGYALG